MGNDDQSSRRARLSSLLAFFKPKPTPQSDLDIPEGYDAIDYKLFLVICDFLQPDSIISPIDAAERAIGVFPYKYPDLRQLISVCFAIAEQIPYHHPSHLKLVGLLWLEGEVRGILRSHGRRFVQFLRLFIPNCSTNSWTESNREPFQLSHNRVLRTLGRSHRRLPF